MNDTSKKQYHLKMKMNDQVFECDTDNLQEAILSFTPKVIKTKIVFEITKGDAMTTKQVFVNKAKMLFRNRLHLDTFVNHLIFKPHG